MKERFLLVLWLTGRCNLRCRYCYAADNPAVTDMDFETARAVLDRLERYPLTVQFAGGEPLLNFPLAERICLYTRERGVDVRFQLQTNGTLITEALARRVKELGIGVGVSLDGVPEINELTRGRTAEVLRGLRLLGEQGMTVGINAVVTGLNAGGLPRLVDLAHYLGNVGGIGLDILRLAGRGAEPGAMGRLSPETLRRALLDMDRERRKLLCLTGRNVQLREVEIARKRLAGRGDPQNYCHAACGRSVVVLPDGRLYPCGSLLEERYYIGTSRDLNPEKLPSVRCPRPESCRDCGYREVCPGGCPARRIRSRLDLDCVMLKTAFELAEGKICENDHEYHSCGAGSGPL